MSRILILILLSSCFVIPSNTLTSEDSHNVKMLIEDEDNVNFMLYTRENPQNYMLLQPEDKDSIKRSHFNGNKGLKLLIHGWLKNYESPMGILLRDSYLKRYDTNVILVDWSALSQRNYITSRHAVEKVGKIVAKLVDTLIEGYGLSTAKVHILGHSLGAHVAGIAGLNIQTGNVSRVTGLDPAGPMFTESDDDRLQPDSANFVDVIHTCGHLLGFLKPLGQVDFYPNKGVYEQPGCGFDYKAKCSHGRAYVYFAESIFSNQFLSVQCNNWDAFISSDCDLPSIPMGEYVPFTAKGKYYLRTNKKSPFAMGNIYAQT